jgi:hypothetical protein
VYIILILLIGFACYSDYTYPRPYPEQIHTFVSKTITTQYSYNLTKADTMHSTQIECYDIRYSLFRLQRDPLKLWAFLETCTDLEDDCIGFAMKGNKVSFFLSLRSSISTTTTWNVLHETTCEPILSDWLVYAKMNTSRV